MSPDPGSTHYVGDGCQLAHDPRIDQADDLTHYMEATARMRERAEKAEAEVERLTGLLDRYALRIDAHSRELAELRPERERLRREIAIWVLIWDDADLLEARVEALRNGTAILGR